MTVNRGKCMVHGQHKPASYTHVNHHIIPREWQYKWNPKLGETTHLRRVWAPDTVTVCPTGHANIHFHIKQIQAEIVLMRFTGSPIVDAIVVVNRYRRKGANQKEVKVAKQAFLNWFAAGGSINSIIN